MGSAKFDRKVTCRRQRDQIGQFLKALSDTWFPTKVPKLQGEFLG